MTITETPSATCTAETTDTLVLDGGLFFQPPLSSPTSSGTPKPASTSR
jgi:hypothetical protein